MYDKLKAKLLILPDWLEQAVNAHRLNIKDIVNTDGLNSILSANDVSFYHTQVAALSGWLEKNPGNPLTSLLATLNLLHKDSSARNLAYGRASGLEEPVKNYTSYGDETKKFDFFAGFDIRPYLPRAIGCRLSEEVLVTPLLSHIGDDTFVLRFAVGEAHKEDVADKFVRTLMEVYGFDALVPTELFDLKTQM